MPKLNWKNLVQGATLVLGLLALDSMFCMNAYSQSSTVKTVFLIVMSNQSWSNIRGNSNAPYINSLIQSAAVPSAYFGLPVTRPMEADYFLLEAGTDFGIVVNAPPSINHQSKPHLVSLLESAGISWKTYQEGIAGNQCPLQDVDPYSTTSNPFVFFDDTTNSLNEGSARCIQHVRPFTELATDLSAGSVAQYNFIRPSSCNAMLLCSPGVDPITQGDQWLSQQLPKILASSAYKSGGAIFIVWDHADFANDGPVGMILLSPFAKTGYTNAVRYTHGSMLRTIQEIFGVLPLLGDASYQPSLEDLFTNPSGSNLTAIVSWTKSLDATSYKVKRSTSLGGPFGTIATAVSATNYIDHGLSAGTTYFYEVSAVNSKGESAPSAPIPITISSAPTSPTNVSVRQTQ